QLTEHPHLQHRTIRVAAAAGRWRTGRAVVTVRLRGVAMLPSMPSQELTTEILALSAVEQAALVREGHVAASQLVEAALRRIARRDGALGAFVHVCAERALAEAEAIRPGDERPLCGVPIGIKDLLSPTDGLPTSEGSAAYGDWVADHDSAHVRRLRDAG